MQAANELITDFLRARILKSYCFHAHIALSLCGYITSSLHCVNECDCYDNYLVFDWSADLILGNNDSLNAVILDLLLPFIKAVFKGYWDGYG